MTTRLDPNQVRENVFKPPQTNRAFRTRQPGFLGGTGRTRDAASLGLQASLQGPRGKSSLRRRRVFAPRPLQGELTMQPTADPVVSKPHPRPVPLDNPNRYAQLQSQVQSNQNYAASAIPAGVSRMRGLYSGR